MDKYESKLRIEEMEKLKDRKQYKEALKLAETIEWTRIRNVVTLYKAADLYRICRNYTKCRELLELAYERNPYAKNVVFALCDVCLEFGDLESATEYYKEYAALAPDEVGILVLKYKMLKALEAGIDERIEILEKIKDRSHIEEWEFELATLYHRAGMAEKCVEECDDIFTWFGEGAFVYKALELKMLHEPLSEEQNAVYQHRLERKAERESRREKRRETGKIMRMSDRPEKKRRPDKKRRPEREYAGEEEKRTEAPAPAKPAEEEEYHVNTINMNPFNTIDLQAELAANVKGYIGGEPSMIVRTTPEEAASETKVYPAKAPGIKESVTEEDFLASYAEELGIEEPESTLRTGDIEVPAEKKKNEVFHNTVPADAKEIFFEDETGEIDFGAQLKPAEDNAKLREFKEDYAKKMEGRELPESLGRLSGEEDMIEEFDGTVPIAGGVMEEKVLEDGTVELIKHFDENVEPEVVKVGRDNRTERRPEKPALQRSPKRVYDEEIIDPDYVNMLPTTEEKQISGQLNISDILAGWEETKRQKEREFKENLRRKTLENTGNLLADFDKEANSGLLATLDNPALINSVTKQSTSDDFIKGISVEDMKKGKKAAYHSAVQSDEDMKIGKVIDAQFEEALAEEEPSVNYDSENEEINDEPIENVSDTVVEKEEAKEPESLYYGNVTAAISGNIWDEVDNYEPQPVDEDKTEETESNDAENAETAESGSESAESSADEQATVSVKLSYDLEEDNKETSEEEKQPEEEDEPQTAFLNASEIAAASAVSEEVSEEPSGEEEAKEEAPAETEEPAAETDDNKEAGEAEDSKEQRAEAAEEEKKAEKKVPERPERKNAPADRNPGKNPGNKKGKKRPNRPEERKSAPANKPAAKAPAAAVPEKKAPAPVQKPEAPASKDDKSVRSFTAEEKHYFEDFEYDSHMKRQIIDAVENMTLAAFAGNLIITSENSETSAKLANAFYKFMKHSDPNFTGKSAKIGAETLNKKDVDEMFVNVTNGALIVAHAGRMTNSTINSILSNLNQDSRGVVVILSDTKPEIRKLLERAAVLERFFNCRVDIANLSLEKMAEKGKNYARSKGYTIDDLAMLAFSGRLSELFIGTHMVTLNETYELVDDAIEHSEKNGMRKVMDIISRKRVDSDGYIILREKDFEYRKKKDE